MTRKTESLSEKDVSFGHKRIFTIDTLKNVIRENNMKVIKSGSYLLKPFDEAKMEKILDEDPSALINGLDLVSRRFSYVGCEIFVEARPIIL